MSKRTISELISLPLICAGIAIICFLLVGQVIEVSGDSMYPTIENGEKTLTEKVSLKFVDLKEGEIVVYESPEEENKLIIKRVAALPGETITIDGTTYEISQGSYFMLGDNRDHSTDSRKYGEIKKERILGRALFVYQPLKNFRLLLQ